MKPAIHYDPEDIKKILAEKYDVDVKNIIKNQYSYTVILDEEPAKTELQEGDGKRNEIQSINDIH